MAGKKLDVQKIEEVDVNDITKIAREKLGDQSADTAKALVDNPAFVEQMKGIVLQGSIEFKGDIVENKVLTPESVSALYDMVKPSMVDFLVYEESFRDFMAFVYSYYVLKMAQGSYDQLPADDKSKVKKYSVGTVGKAGEFEIKFADEKKAEEGPEEFGGVKCKPGKSFDNLANLLENLKINLEGFEGEVPKDLDFSKGVNDLIPGLMVQFAGMGDTVNNYRSFVEGIFDGDSSDFPAFFVKVSAAYYMKEVEDQFKEEYKIGGALADAFKSNEKFKIDYS
ncbi:MAG: hypothetical protein PHP74_02195, partial [Candidatus Gracilibacteria bacterium]|nr:hypothetical protein [Candidatus Gracilibacteria bacterium]